MNFTIQTNSRDRFYWRLRRGKPRLYHIGASLASTYHRGKCLTTKVCLEGGKFLNGRANLVP